VPKPLFHRGENFGFAMRLGIDDPIGMKPNTGESRREKVASGEAPQDRAFVARKNAGREQRGAGRVLARGAGLHDLMKGAKREPAGRKTLVELAHSERQDSERPTPVLKPLYALA
jgi:hypothetical protein